MKCSLVTTAALCYAMFAAAAPLRQAGDAVVKRQLVAGIQRRSDVVRLADARSKTPRDFQEEAREDRYYSDSSKGGTRSWSTDRSAANSYGKTPAWSYSKSTGKK